MRKRKIKIRKHLRKKRSGEKVIVKQHTRKLRAYRRGRPTAKKPVYQKAGYWMCPICNEYTVRILKGESPNQKEDSGISSKFIASEDDANPPIPPVSFDSEGNILEIKSIEYGYNEEEKMSGWTITTKKPARQIKEAYIECTNKNCKIKIKDCKENVCETKVKTKFTVPQHYENMDIYAYIYDWLKETYPDEYEELFPTKKKKTFKELMDDPESYLEY
jgi:hypothetical protein